MKGLYNVRPSLPRYSAIWDPDTVLTYLYRLHPRRKLSLKLLTLKVTMLLALLTVQRVQTLHLIKLENVSMTTEYVQIVINSTLKTSRPSWHLDPIVFTRFNESRRLCIVRYLREYIKRTSTLRGSETHLLISFRKPHKKVTKSTISRWLKLVLCRAGIDISIYKAHSTRAASASKVCTQVPIEKILKAGGWSGDSAFLKHYKLAPLRSDVQNAMLQKV